jgi:hypothetical protein
MRERLLAGSLAALVLASTVGNAETLVLKDGKKIPCRVLCENDTQVTIRDAEGSQVTFPTSEVDHIDYEVSSVEVYEAVAERIRPNSGCLPYYLALWVMELDMGRERDAKRLLTMAARDIAWRGRAFAAMAKLVQNEDEAKGWMRRARDADPTLGLKETQRAGATTARATIPRDMLMRMAGAANDFAGGRYAEAANKLRGIQGSRNREAVEDLNARLSGFTGVDIATLLLRAQNEARRGGATQQVAEEARPVNCGACNSTGYLTCSVCNGKGFRSCKACGGSGVTSHRVHNSKRGTSTITKTCRQCGGTGGQACAVCLRIPRGGTQGVLLEFTCDTCNGKGVVPLTVSPTATRLPTRTGSCGRCTGSGRASKTFQTSASGTRRCMKCNRDGKIPRFGGGVGFERVAATGMAPVVTARTPVEVLGDETLSKLISFAGLARLAADGQAGYSWRSGSTLSLYAKDATLDPSEEVIFTCGQWVNPRLAESVKKRAKMYGHKPRAGDPSMFVTWMNDRIQQHLEEAAIAVGEGTTAADQVRALAQVYECNTRIGRTPTFDARQVYKTTFRPADRGDATATCQWGISRQTGQARIALCLFRKTDCWPTVEIVARPSPGVGVDTMGVANKLAPKGNTPLTVYYRVRGCARSTTGSGDSAGIKCTLEIEPILIGAGRNGRDGLWTAGGQQLGE